MLSQVFPKNGKPSDLKEKLANTSLNKMIEQIFYVKLDYRAGHKVTRSVAGCNTKFMWLYNDMII